MKMWTFSAPFDWIIRTWCIKNVMGSAFIGLKGAGNIVANYGFVRAANNENFEPQGKKT